MENMNLQSDTTDLLEAAFVKAQREFPTIGKDSTARFKYASAPAIIKAIVPILTKYGLNIKQKGIPYNNELFPMIIITQLAHESGQYSQSWWPVLMPQSDELRGMTTIQGLMANKSYVERHALKSLLCLAVDDEDNDGDYQPQVRTQSPIIQTEKISEKQLAFLEAKIDGSLPRETFIKQKYKVQDLSDIKRNDFNEILKLFENGNK